MPIKRTAAKSSKAEKRVRIEDLSLFSRLADDTVLQILQLLELRHALTFAKSCSRIARIYATNRDRLRRAYKRWIEEAKPFGGKKETPGVINVYFKEDARRYTPADRKILVKNRGASMDLASPLGGPRFLFITFIFQEELEEEPQFEIVTGQFVAHIRDLGDEELDWGCEMKHGKLEDVTTFILNVAAKKTLDPKFKLELCEMNNPNEESLRCVPPTIEIIRLHFDGRCSISMDRVIDLVEKTTPLREFRFESVPEWEFSFTREFFASPAVQKLESIRLGASRDSDASYYGAVHVELDNELVEKFMNTKIWIGHGDTKVTWRSIRTAIDAWKSNSISRLEWRFNVRQPRTVRKETIWAQLLDSNVEEPNSSSQCIRRLTNWQLLYKKKPRRVPKYEELHIHILKYDESRQMQLIKIGQSGKQVES